MAYMSQEQKKEIVALAKPILKKYGVKATFAVDNRSTIVCNIKSGAIDFISNAEDVERSNSYISPNFTFNKPERPTHIGVNPYHYKKDFSGSALAFLTELFAVLNRGNWDKSDIQSDYFNVGWYVNVNIGKYNKPYVVEA